MRRVLLALLLAGCAAQPDAAPPADPRAGAGPAYVTRAPSEEDPVQWGIGRPVAFAYQTIEGDAGRLVDLLEGSRGVVVVFTSLECPVTRLYAPVIAERAREWQELGLRVLAVAAAPQDAGDDLRARAQRLGWTFPTARDPDFAITTALGAERTADTFLIGPQARLVYRGALDDQYGINYRRVAPRRRYLDDAIRALLRGAPIDVAATDAPGCLLR